MNPNLKKKSFLGRGEGGKGGGGLEYVNCFTKNPNLILFFFFFLGGGGGRGGVAREGLE